MTPTILRANCKVNLSLRITGVLPNGYHTLDSFFLPLPAPCDLLHVAPGAKAGLTLRCSDPALESADNSLMRAYSLYAEASSFAPPLELKLEKGIPVGAGLGGGSSDAAALLCYLNARAPHPLDLNAMNALAVRAGADVPFFLQTSPCRVQGIGEALEPLVPGLRSFWLVLACPDVKISTLWAYAAWDRLHSRCVSHGLTMCDSEAKKIKFGRYFLNDLEKAVFPQYPELERIKREFYRQGAAAAVMSGSGSSQFGLFREQRVARNVAEFFQARGIRTYCHALSR